MALRSKTNHCNPDEELILLTFTRGWFEENAGDKKGKGNRKETESKGRIIRNTNTNALTYLWLLY